MKTKLNLIQICLLCAVVLQTVSSGAQTLQTLVSFNITNGVYPHAALTLGTDGNFYGEVLALCERPIILTPRPGC